MIPEPHPSVPAQPVSGPPHSAVAIASVALVVMGLSLVLHEAGHALVGALAGGRPTLITATEVRGDFSALSPGGFIALGAAGMVTNAGLAVVALAVLRARRPVGTVGLFWWFLFAFGGMLVATKTVGESAAQWGDWMTILRRLPQGAGPRRVILLCGLVGTWAMVALSRRTLADHLLAVGVPERRREARRILGVAALAGLLLAAVSGGASAVGPARGIGLALAAVLGPLSVLFLSTLRLPPARADAPSPSPAVATPAWVAAAVALLAVVGVLLGPGLGLD